jgi:hypothetical protein
MSVPANRPILVTGSQRSGSTWVGQMIASHPKVVYLWEPFNPGALRTPAKYWYHHVTPADEEQFRAFLQPYLTFRYPWWADVKDRVHPRRIVGATYRTALCWWRRQTGCRTLMKDPSALFSAEWLAKTYGMNVVVLIRHPAAYVSSLKRLRWGVWYSDLWNQRALMEDHLAPFYDEVRRCMEHLPDLLGQAILLWRIIHHVIRRFQQDHPDWIYLRHEDLSRRPMEEFQSLLGRLGLDMPPCVRQAIETHTSAENPREAPERIAHQLKRDSQGNIWNWRTRLRPEEIARVRKATEDIAPYFYSDADWYGENREVRRSA